MKHILVLGGTGYLGPEIIKSLLSDGFLVSSISRKPMPIDFNDKVPNFEHFIFEIEEKESFRNLMDIITIEKGKLDSIIVMTNKGTRLINLDQDFGEFAKEMSNGPTVTYIILSICRNYLKTDSSIVVFGSLWASKVPFKGIYLDLPIEPSLSLCTSKAALNQLVFNFAGLYAKDKIRVNIITPGWFPRPGKTDRADYIKQITTRTPLGRIGTPQDLIGPVKFLIGDSSKFITGQNLVVDGGFNIY
jgi:NAD(P)-dependent dehydrogenase (short-subunit alcohol dehydrogenase family)